MSESTVDHVPARSLPRFGTEILLQQAIASLFARMPNVTDVQVLQGNSEIGKDIVFTSTGPVGESLHCAAVVKNTPLTGKVGSKGSLRAAFDQIEQCLDTPYLDARGEMKRIHRVYVISPHQISQATTASIEGRLRSRAGQVVFLTGSELLRLFHKYWHEFLLDEASLLERFSRALDSATGNARAFSLLAFDNDLGNIGDRVSQVYVAPTFERLVRQFQLKPIADYFPDEKLWTKPAIDKVLTGCSALAESIAHLRDWPCAVGLSSQDADSALSAIGDVVTALSEGVVSAYRAHSEVAHATIVNIPPDFTVTLGDEDWRRLSYLANVARVAVSLFVRPVVEHFALHPLLMKSLRLRDQSLLVDADFKRACLVDDCLQAARTPFAATGKPEVFDLGPAILSSYSGDLLIVGGPGTGKTSFCRRNALLDAEKFSNGESRTVPMYIALHKLTRIDVTSFEETFLAAGRNSALLGDLGTRTQGGRLRCYLDGLDEVPLASHRDALLTLALHGRDRPADCQIIITARDYLYDRSCSALLRIRLSGLDDRGLLQLAKAWLDDDSSSAEACVSQIKQSSIEEIVRVPMLATVAVLVFKRTRRIPAGRSRLYSTFVNLLCGGWDLAKGVVRPTQFNINMKQIVLMGLANSLQEAGVREFTPKMFASVTKRPLGVRVSSEYDRLLDELLRDGIVTKSGETLHFCHQSVQEFLSAKYKLGDPSGTGFRAAVRAYIKGNDWWREVIRFYIGLSDNPSGVERWLRANIPREVRSDRREFLFSAVREAYPEFGRHEPWKW